MTGKRVVGDGGANRGNRSALALRSSIFGGTLSTRDEVRFRRKPVDWRDIVVEGRGKAPQSTGALAGKKDKNKKRTLNEIAAEAVAAQAAGTELYRAEPRKQSATDRADPREQSRRKQPVLKQSQRKSKPQQHPSPVKSARPKMRGSFYGTDQPLPALVPVRQLPSYSDQTDVSDLIDDGSNSDDGEWAGEFTNLLGSYAAKDFSKVDQQTNYKMQATGEEIFEAEQQTLRLGIERDLEERRLLKLKERKRLRRKGQLVLID